MARLPPSQLGYVEYVSQCSAVRIHIHSYILELYRVYSIGVGQSLTGLIRVLELANVTQDQKCCHILYLPPAEVNDGRVIREHPYPQDETNEGAVCLSSIQTRECSAIEVGSLALTLNADQHCSPLSKSMVSICQAKQAAPPPTVIT